MSHLGLYAEDEIKVMYVAALDGLSPSLLSQCQVALLGRLHPPEPQSSIRASPLTWQTHATITR